MISNIIRAILERKYSMPENSLYTHRFLSDYSPSIIYDLNPEDILASYYSFEPQNCKIEELLEGTRYDFNRRFEVLINNIMKSLLIYGKAYLNIQSIKENNKILKISLEEKQGIFAKHIGRYWVFWSVEYNGINKKHILQPKDMIEFSLNEVGYRKNHFKKMLKSLRKYDAFSNNLINKKESPSYDFVAHSNYNKKKVFQITKEIGWIFGVENLSDSDYLYRKIQQKRFVEKVLNYILDKINNGLETYLNDHNLGRIVVNTKQIEYEKVWNDYQKGDITTIELQNMLFRIKD